MAISALPPLMDMSGVDPAAHVTCFSNALEGQFFNPTAAHAGGRADHYSLASSSPFVASFAPYGGQLHHGVNLVQLLESNGYGGLVDMAGKQQPACKGQRERLSASQDTGLTSDVNPEISSSSGEKFDHEAALWSY